MHEPSPKTRPIRRRKMVIDPVNETIVQGIFRSLSRYGLTGTCPSHDCRRHRRCRRPPVPCASVARGAVLPPCIARSVACDLPEGRHRILLDVMAMAAQIASRLAMDPAVTPWPDDPDEAWALRAKLAILHFHNGSDGTLLADRLAAWIAADPSHSPAIWAATRSFVRKKSLSRPTTATP